MDAFLTTFPAVMFKITIVLFVLLLITGTARRLVINKTIKAVFELPEEKRKRLIRVYAQTISIWRMLLWAAPIYLLAVPIAIYFFLPDYFRLTITLMIGAYIMFVDDFFYKKTIMRSIGNSESEKK